MELLLFLHRYQYSTGFLLLKTFPAATIPSAVGSSAAGGLLATSAFHLHLLQLPLSATRLQVSLLACFGGDSKAGE